MITGKENVIKFVRLNGCGFWHIQNYEGKINIYSQDDERATDLETSLDDLQARLDNMSPGNYSIECWKTKGQTKNRFYDKIQIPNSDGKTPTIGNLPMVGFTKEEIQVEIQKALEHDRKEREVEALKKELADAKARVKELEGELDSSSHRIEKRLTKIFGDFNAPERPASVDGLNEDENRIAAALEKWSEIDGDYIGVLGRIAKYAETNRTQYDMVKKMLPN